MNRALQPALKPFPLPSGRIVSFRQFTMWEKRFIMHCYSPELREDGIIDQELLAGICLVNIDGRPVDFGGVLDAMDNFINHKGVGSVRLNPLKKSEVCNIIYNTILEFFNYDELDWQYYVGVWAGICLPSDEVRARIDADIKNVLGGITSTEAASRMSQNPQELVNLGNSEGSPVKFVGDL
jgi:hypothetical protein